MEVVTFTVLGEPASQGSKKHVGRGIMVEASKQTRPWRQAVAAEAALAMGDNPPLTGAVWVVANFTFARPKAHYGTGRNAGTLKRSAPFWMETGPDADKLIRAIGDAISGIVIRDDRQIAVWDVQKVYGERPQAHVTIRPVSALEQRVEAA